MINLSQILDKNSYPIPNGKKPVKWGIFTRHSLIGSYEDYAQAKRKAWQYARDYNTETWLVKMHKKYTPTVVVTEKNYQK